MFSLKFLKKSLAFLRFAILCIYNYIKIIRKNLLLLLPYIVQIQVLVGDHHQKLPDSLSVFFLSHFCFLELSLHLLQGIDKRKKTERQLCQLIQYCFSDQPITLVKI